MTRAAFLTSRLGQPWAPTRTCWHVAGEVQRELFGRQLPDVAIPAAPSWRWMIDTIGRHPERSRWEPIATGPHGIITAPDGALVAMGRADLEAHIGVWLAPERQVIHCDQRFGVLAQDMATLRASGWGRIQFYQPVE